MERQSNADVNSDSNQTAQAPPKNSINKKTNIPKAPACDFCNKRKIKCDGALPCFQCKKRNVQCQYERQPLSKEEKMKRRLDNPEYLKQKMEALKIELENQKNISAYWKQKYQEATNGDLVNQLLTRKPRFKEDTMTFCSQTETAITSVFSAVYAIVEPFLPSYPREYSLEYATNLWNKCLDKIPEDFVPSIRSSDAETIVKMSEYCSLFAVGSRALGILDLSEHFQNVSQSLLLIAIMDLNAQENTAICNHLAMSLIHLLIYFIISGRYVAIRTLISATLGFLDNVEQYIHEAPLDLLYSVLCITAMDPLQRVLWAKKLSLNANATDPRTIAISGFITCIGAMLLPEFNFTETDLTPIRLKVIEIEPFVSAVEDVDVKSNFELFLSLMKAACSLQDPEMLLLHINNVAVCFQKLQRVESRLWITSVIDYVLYLLSRYQNPERLNFFWTVRNELQRVLGTVSDQTNSTSDNTPSTNNNNLDNNSNNSNESPQAYQSPEGIAPAFSGFNFNEFLTNETGPSLPDDLTTDFTDLM